VTTLPLLRRVDAQTITREGRTVVRVRDLEGVPDNAVLVSRRFYLVAALLDGDRTAEQLRLAYATHTGDTLPEADLERIVALFGEQGLLDSPTFERRRRATETPYRDAALRPPHHAGHSYPNDPAELRGAMDMYSARVDRGRLTGARARGAIAPHIDLPRGGVASSAGHVGVLESVDFSHVGPCFGDAEPVTEEAAHETRAADARVFETIVAGDAEAFWRTVTGDGNPCRIEASPAVYTPLRALAPARTPPSL